MRGAALGWTIAGATIGVTAGVVAGTAAANREARERMSASARTAKQRMSAQADEVQRRLSEARQEVRDTAEHLREQSRESFGRALLQAAEARDASLDDTDDPDSDDDLGVDEIDGGGGPDSAVGDREAGGAAGPTRSGPA